MFQFSDHKGGIQCTKEKIYWHPIFSGWDLITSGSLSSMKLWLTSPSSVFTWRFYFVRKPTSDSFFSVPFLMPLFFSSNFSFHSISLTLNYLWFSLYPSCSLSQIITSTILTIFFRLIFQKAVQWPILTSWHWPLNLSKIQKGKNCSFCCQSILWFTFKLWFSLPHVILI